MLGGGGLAVGVFLVLENTFIPASLPTACLCFDTAWLVNEVYGPDRFNHVGFRVVSHVMI